MPNVPDNFDREEAVKAWLADIQAKMDERLLSSLPVNIEDHEDYALTRLLIWRAERKLLAEITNTVIRAWEHAYVPPEPIL